MELLALDETAEQRQVTIGLVTDEIDRMTDIVNDLMVLAQADQPDFLHREPMDVAELISEVHRKATAIAARDWLVVTPRPTVFSGGRHRLPQALLQLADDAAKHTSDGDRIELGARVDRGIVRLWVDDSGHGVPPQDAERIFKPFGRGGQTADTTAPGSV